MSLTEDQLQEAAAILASRAICQATNISHFVNAPIVKCTLWAGHALSKMNHWGEEADGVMREWDF